MPATAAQIAIDAFRQALRQAPGPELLAAMAEVHDEARQYGRQAIARRDLGGRGVKADVAELERRRREADDVAWMIRSALIARGLPYATADEVAYLRKAA